MTDKEKDYLMVLLGKAIENNEIVVVDDLQVEHDINWIYNDDGIIKIKF
jgi:hypothetical protein